MLPYNEKNQFQIKNATADDFAILEHSYRGIEGREESEFRNNLICTFNQFISHVNFFNSSITRMTGSSIFLDVCCSKVFCD